MSTENSNRLTDLSACIWQTVGAAFAGAGQAVTQEAVTYVGGLRR